MTPDEACGPEEEPGAQVEVEAHHPQKGSDVHVPQSVPEAEAQTGQDPEGA